MHGYWQFRTEHGAFRIVPDAARFVAFFESEPLGSYASAEQALEDLVGGSTAWPSIGDPANFGLPDDLSEWEFMRALN